MHRFSEHLHMKRFTSKKENKDLFWVLIHKASVKGNVVRTNVYHKYIKDLKLNITIDLDGFIY